MKIARNLSMLLLLTMLAMLASCSSDDTTTPEDDPDTDAPVVVNVDPTQSDTNVDVGEDVTITFDEDMDAGSATDNITLSHGTINDLDWVDDKTLEVEHTNWPEGTEITVTVGTGLSDVAGNSLDQAFAWSFWTYTDDVILQNTLPADGATDVALNTSIWFEFNASMNGTTLTSAITVTSPDKATHSYNLSGTDEQWTLTFDDDLPATTAITVTITTTAEDDSGTPLAAETTIGFTTGNASDNTPPNLLSIEPADGTTFPADTSFLRLTFDEPIDDDSLEPSEVSGALMLAMGGGDDNTGVWTENNTVFTVPLDPPLTPGAIFFVRFESFTDMHGNVNDTPTEWTATVAGTPDFMPVVDDLLMGYMGTWTDDVLKEGGELWRVTRYDVKTGGEFWRWEDEQYGFSPPNKDFDFEEYERFRLTASAVQYLGFYEAADGGGKAQFEVAFNPPIEWIRIPMPAAGYFIEGTSNFVPTPEDGPDRVDYDITFDETVYTIEVPYGGDKQGSDPTTLWLGCRKAIVNYEVKGDMVTYSHGTDTIWFCPGVGPVRMTGESHEGSDIYLTSLYLVQVGFED